MTISELIYGTKENRYRIKTKHRIIKLDGLWLDEQVVISPSGVILRTVGEGTLYRSKLVSSTYYYDNKIVCHQDHLAKMFIVYNIGNKEIHDIFVNTLQSYQTVQEGKIKLFIIDGGENK